MQPLTTTEVQEFLKTYDHEAWAREFILGDKSPAEREEIGAFLNLPRQSQLRFLASTILPYYKELLPWPQAREVANLVAGRNHAAIAELAREIGLAA